MIEQKLIPVEEVECSSCGKVIPGDCTFMDMNLSAPMPKKAAGVKLSAGPFAGGIYHICYECALNAMGVSNLRRENE